MNDNNNGQEIENIRKTGEAYITAGVILILCVVLAGIV
jgi:uncharacterized membrane protein